jgi:hypothetical protein
MLASCTYGLIPNAAVFVGQERSEPMERTTSMRTVIAEIVRSIRPYDALEQQHLANILTWIESGAPVCRKQKPATPSQHLVAYFVLFDPTTQQVLLVDHTQAGLWLPTGGYVEPNEHPQTTVVCEAREELQIEAVFVFSQPIFLSVWMRSRRP